MKQSQLRSCHSTSLWPCSFFFTHKPRPPQPITPTRIVSVDFVKPNLAAGPASARPVAVSAELRRNSRRVKGVSLAMMFLLL